MPMDRKLYPEDWETIALEVKEAADWHCVECGRPCRRPGQRFLELASLLIETGWIRVGDDNFEHPTRFVLTVSHTDHNPANCQPENLRALCAPCHCRYDLQPSSMAIKKRLTLERNGQLTLGV